MMKRDIENRADLEHLLAEFYSVAMKDGEIGHHFDELDLETHLPVITDFWEKVLFGVPVYFGNPFIVHAKLHGRSPLLIEHFARWVEIFTATIDNFFSGEMAEAAKLRAQVIARNLGNRLNSSAFA